MKVISNLLHRSGVFLTQPIFSAISAVFDRVKIWLHELLIIYLITCNHFLNILSPYLKLIHVIRIDIGIKITAKGIIPPIAL